ncbi:hypothetical protein C4573_00705 [Candidatus Woesearchaeota archaeon]|nr:MAG: hypothetical protein C4573_00705 [Candidatus Woesearchaeota archaeon]
MEENQDELLFGVSEEPQAPRNEKNDPFSIISHNVNDLERRLRVLEERYTNLRKKTQITDQNMLENEKHLSKEIRGLTDSVSELKFQMQELAEKLAIFNSEFEHVAQKTDVQMIEKYLDLWQPMNFVTREELKKAKKE